MASRRWIGIMAIVAVFSALLVAPSIAAVVNPGDIIRFSSAPDRDSGFSGGAFRITDFTTGSEWYSFCLEKNEYISFGPDYTVDSIGPAAVNGGVGGGNPDFISSQTAYLYYLYATGGLSDVTGAGTAAQQTALQKAFWYLEEEIGLPTDALALSFLAIASGATPGDYYGVAVVNPLNAAGAASQSQLVYVPEPGALLLLGSGLLALAGYRRPRRTA